MVYFPSWFRPGRATQLAITCNCLQAFLLFGYDQGVLGGLISHPDFLDTVDHPNATFLGFIVSSYNIGCLVGCVANFFLGNRFGRRHAIWTAMLFILVGTVIQCTTFGTPQLIVGRIITGIGVGIDTSTVPMYQAELCKTEVRGQLVTTEVLFTGIGVTIAYFLDYGMSKVPGGVAWRVPIALQAIPAFLVSIVLFGLPETPRWLMQHGRPHEAVEVMAKVYGLSESDDLVLAERDSIAETIRFETENPFRWSRLFEKDTVNTGWRIFLACLVLTMNQLAGINIVVFYIATVLEVNVGLSRDLSLIVGGCVNLAFVVGSFVPALGLDRLGRKPPMMFGCAGAAISMMLIAVLLSFKGTDKGEASASASIAFFITFMICFGISMNAIPWCYSAEILPLKARAKGTSLAVMVNWIWVFTIVMVTPIMIEKLQWKTYLIFMSTNTVFVPAVYFLFPETKGVSLEEIDHLFTPGLAMASDNSMPNTNSDVEKMEATQHVE